LYFFDCLLVFAYFFGTVSAGYPFSGGTYFRGGCIADETVGNVGFVGCSVRTFEYDRGYFSYIFAYPFRFSCIFAVVYPIEHAEIGVLPRGAVDDFAVCGDAAGHDADPDFFIAEIFIGYGQFVRYTVNPEQWLVQIFQSISFFCVTYPIPTVCGSL